MRVLVTCFTVLVLGTATAAPGWAEDSDRIRYYLQLRGQDTNPWTGVHDAMSAARVTSGLHGHAAELAGELGTAAAVLSFARTSSGGKWFIGRRSLITTRAPPAPSLPFLCGGHASTSSPSLRAA